MPIYAYRCSNCGHAQDVLQRIADPVLTVCPACGQTSYVKQVTAAGFQLKGSGWYVTDFRGDGKPAKTAESGDAEKPADKGAEKAAEQKTGTESAGGAKNGETAKQVDSAPAAAVPASSAAPAPATPPSPGKPGS
jgi:putative FmdB family regulatory protein